MGFKEYLFYLRELFFPNGCAVCGEALLKVPDAWFGLCAACRDHFLDFLKNERRCQTCGKPLVSEKDFCLSCRGREGRSAQILKRKVIFPYFGEFKKVLAAYKFRKVIALGNFFLLCLETALQDFLNDGDKDGKLKDAVWVPVPPRPGKVKKEGWDQIEFLARLIEKEKGLLPLSRCLKRLPSRSQKVLNREERSKNLQKRILCVKTPPKTAIIFDDVITTGATLDACASALLEGGAEKVYAVCLFFD